MTLSKAGSHQLVLLLPDLQVHSSRKLMASGKSPIHPERYTSTALFGGGPRNSRNCAHSWLLIVVLSPSSFHAAWIATASSLWPGESFRNSPMFFFGFLTLAM